MVKTTGQSVLFSHISHVLRGLMCITVYCLWEKRGMAFMCLSKISV